MVRITFPVGPLACNCSIVADESAGEAIVIDPGDRIDEILRILRQRGWRLAAIAVTHAHIDHIGGAAALKQRTGAPIWLNERDLELYGSMPMQAAWLGVRPPPVAAIDASLHSGNAPACGGLRIDVMETPGHTQGSVCLHLPAEALLFAGDTLFAGSVGRTDLPGGDAAQLMASLRDRVLALPDATAVVAGHGPETTIARERHTNPFLVGIR